MKTGKIFTLVTTVVLLLIASVGISYAWFSQRAALSTLVTIIPPDSIEIIPIDSDGRDATMLDLDFKEGTDTKNEETGEITIRRPVYIYSTSPVHQLEVVHTTNLNMLEFKIYPATAEKDQNGDIIEIDYDKKKYLGVECINPKPDNSSLAKPENLNNYKKGEIVEAHAYPLYWLAENSGDGRYVSESDKDQIQTHVSSESETKFDPAKQVDKTYYKTYYYIEISWQESTKETDLFYVMAQNIAVTAIEEGSGTTP